MNEADSSQQVIDFFNKEYKKYDRYWYSKSPDRYSPKISENETTLFAQFLRRLNNEKKPGFALDLGAGEGSASIKLAAIGYEVDAVEGSFVGAEKIKKFADIAGVGSSIKIINDNVYDVELKKTYDVVICNGLLHYISNKSALLDKIRHVTSVGGYNMVSLFTDENPIPEYHRATPLFRDSENGLVFNFYSAWERIHFSLTRNKLDISHLGASPHSHSMIKIIARKA